MTRLALLLSLAASVPTAARLPGPGALGPGTGGAPTVGAPTVVQGREERRQDPASEAGAALHVCPPCGAECHFTSYPGPGACGVCGMTLVPVTTVPQVGVLLEPGTEPASSLGLLGVFANSNAVRAFTVSDTDELLRIDDVIEVKPQFAFGDAPPLDVLVVPEGWGAWEDELVLEWVRGAVEHARCVIAVGRGSVVLARAGFLAGEVVPGDHFLSDRGKELAPEVRFDADVGGLRAGKFWLARDLETGIDASLSVVAEIAGLERAQRTAARLGRQWEPGLWSEDER